MSQSTGASASSTTTRRRRRDPARSVVRSVPARQVRDLCSREGAETLAHELREFWHSHGYPLAEFWAEKAKTIRPHLAEDDHEGGLFVVRSNLVAGLPPVAPPDD